MRDLRRTARYRKDPGNEDLLRRLNHLLAPVQDDLNSAVEEPRLPVIFVIGAMRSGTTLVSQVLAQDGAFGYVCNITARFWAAPGVGAMISRVLQDDRGRMTFESEYGVTSGWHEPHEFGYLWSSIFDPRGEAETHALAPEALERVDAGALRRAVASLEDVHKRPMVFKNNTWCTLQADWLSRIFPRSIFVVCRRHPLYVAQSVLRGRIKRHGSREAWWSIRPASYDEIRSLPPHEQVVRQVLDIGDEMDARLAQVPAERIVDASYQTLCDDPADLVARIRGACAAQGTPLEPSRAAPQAFQSTDRQSVDDEDWAALKEALLKHRPALL